MESALKLTMEPRQLQRRPSKYFEVYSCVEDSIATVCGWLQTDYELMFAGSWNFSYTSSGSQQETKELGFESVKHMLLYEVYGLFGERLRSDYAADLQRIKAEIDKGAPVLLSVDCFWCPWDTGFQVNHNSGHNFVAVGYNEAGLIGVDGYFMQKNALIPYEYLEKGYMAHTILHLERFAPLGDRFEAAARQLLNRFLSMEERRDVYAQMLDFAEAIAAGQDIPIQREDIYLDQNHSNLWGVLTEIANGRVEFAIALQYLSQRLQGQDAGERLAQWADRLWQCGEQWHVVKLLLTDETNKCMKKQPQLLVKAARRIRQTAELELELAGELAAWLNSH